MPADEHEPATAGPAAASQSAAAGLVLAGELADPQTGTRVVLEHIVNILLVQIVRAWLADQHSAHAGPSWLRGLGDAATLRVLLALHEHPARAWTARELADTAGVSVSTLTRRFTSLVDMTPAEYLRRWRLDLAAHRLRTSDRPVAAVARSVGYTSEFAFTRAFTRHQGQPPARYRSRSRRLASRAAQPGRAGGVSSSTLAGRESPVRCEPTRSTAPSPTRGLRPRTCPHPAPTILPVGKAFVSRNGRSDKPCAASSRRSATRPTSPWGACCTTGARPLRPTAAVGTGFGAQETARHRQFIRR